MVTNQNDDMKLFADNLWQYFQPMLVEQLEHNIGWFRAVVTANNGDGTLEVQRPFDNPFTVKAVASMRNASVGTNVLVFTFGGNLGTNAIVMGNADGRNIGGGSGSSGGSVTTEDVGIGQYEEPLIQIANGGTGARTAEGALGNLGVGDYIIEQGTESIWTYRKWASGIAECWGVQYYTNLVLTRQYGAVYLSQNAQSGVDYPFTISSPVVQRNVLGTNSWVMGNSEPSTTNTGDFWVCRPNSSSSVTVGVGYYVWGMWK